MDVNLFGKVNYCLLMHITFPLLQSAELGVDSAEMRELFLSKIYELNNPSGSVTGMQDDFHRKLGL